MINSTQRTDRKLYEAPRTWVVEVENEGIICESSRNTEPEGTRQDYGGPIDRNY